MALTLPEPQPGRAGQGGQLIPEEARGPAMQMTRLHWKAAQARAFGQLTCVRNLDRETWRESWSCWWWQEFKDTQEEALRPEGLPGPEGARILRK